MDGGQQKDSDIKGLIKTYCLARMSGQGSSIRLNWCNSLFIHVGYA